MKRLNLIVVFNKDLTKVLFCIRAKRGIWGITAEEKKKTGERKRSAKFGRGWKNKI